jgi:hypothetical protein
MDNIIQDKIKSQKGKNYFTKETEEAIVKYNNTPDPREKSNIYQKHIHFPFYKLTENIIHNYKFYYTEVENLEDLQHEIMVFLIQKLNYFNPPKNVEDKINKIVTKEFKENYNNNFQEYVNFANTIVQQQINDFIFNLDVSDECKDTLKKIKVPKAYSYFGTITKRWLIVYNNKTYNKQINNISLSNLLEDYDDVSSFVISNTQNKRFDVLENPSNIEEDDLDKKGYKYNDKLHYFIDLFVEYCTSNIYQFFPKKNDAKIADAILELFRKRENIDVFNKKALYIYIREMVDVKTPKITKITKTLSNIFKEQYLFYLDNGYFKGH